MPNLLNKYSPLLIILLSLCIATIFRIVLPWDAVFTSNGVFFQGVDAYYYLHIADLTAQNGMTLPKFDPYFDFPMGLDYSQLASSYNAYGYFIALLAWVIALGHPTKQVIDAVGALHPAILGILALIPLFVITYLLTKNKWVASGAILLGSVMPGEYMGRAMLGSADTHCLEIFLFSYLMTFTVMALTDGKLRILYIVLSGLFATAYLVIWQGAVIYVILIAGFSCLWLIWSRIKGNPDYKTICTIAAILSISMVLYLIMSSNSSAVFMLIAPLIIMILLIGYTAFTPKLKNWVYLLPLGVVITVLVGFVASVKFVGYYTYPTWFYYMVNQAYNLVAWHVQSTTAEELPLLITLGTVSPEVPLAYFSVAFYLTFIGIGMIIYKWLKHNNMNMFMLLVWTVILLIPTLAMRRFSYYFAINVVILSAIVIWELCKFNYERAK
jgi:dolichyl-diphosphooligosaccharide--protein glycosyltransferase